MKAVMIKGLNEVGKEIKRLKVMIMGLTYKENMPGTWESPAVGIVEELKEFEVEVYGYDPMLCREEIEGFGMRTFEDGEMDGGIVAVAHGEFRRMRVEDVRGFMGDKPVLVDVRGTFDERETGGKGFCYKGL